MVNPQTTGSGQVHSPAGSGVVSLSPTVNLNKAEPSADIYRAQQQQQQQHKVKTLHPDYTQQSGGQTQDLARLDQTKLPSGS